VGNVLSAFFFGWLATVLLQSSSVVTAAAVVLVLHGLPLVVALPVVLGANIGTTATVGFLGGAWARSWGADRHVRSIAWIHVLVNVAMMSLILLWLIIMPQGNPLRILSSLTAGALQNAPAPVGGTLLESIHLAWLDALHWLCGGLTWLAFLLLGYVGVVMVLLGLRWMSLILQGYYAIGRERLLMEAVTVSPWRAFAVGVLMTAVFISSSAVTCMLLPLAASGLLTARRAVPLVLGANVGTTLTALGVGLALQDEQRFLALQLGAFHLWINIVMAIIFVGISPVRDLLAVSALRLTDLAARSGRPALWTTGLMTVLHILVPSLSLGVLFLLG
jgi:sodium-dependent phosphate cotransporter